jgi:transcriptional antiterminator NusG
MKRWYVIQVYAGYEEHVKEDLERRVQGSGFGDKMGEVLIPSAKMKGLFVGVEAKSEQLFPGYVLIELEIVPGIIRFVTSSPRVLRFLGGKNPAPLSAKEVERVRSQVEGRVAVAREKRDFLVGSEVEIEDGPFAGFVGIVERIDDESKRLTVMVSIFGRMTPVELGFNQIKQ